MISPAFPPLQPRDDAVIIARHPNGEPWMTAGIFEGIPAVSVYDAAGRREAYFDAKDTAMVLFGPGDHPGICLRCDEDGRPVITLYDKDQKPTHQFKLMSWP